MSPGKGKVEEEGWTGRVDQLTDWMSRLLRRTERLFVPWILEAAVTSTSLREHALSGACGKQHRPGTQETLTKRRPVTLYMVGSWSTVREEPRVPQECSNLQIKSSLRCWNPW